MTEVSFFEYLYQDGSNFKSWGGVLLAGKVSADAVARLISRFDAEQFFVVEQFGLPALYRELWDLSDGPTDADHVWHTFYALRPANASESIKPIFGTLEEFVLRVDAVVEWNQELSPHWRFWGRLTTID